MLKIIEFSYSDDRGTVREGTFKKIRHDSIQRGHYVLSTLICKHCKVQIAEKAIIQSNGTPYVYRCYFEHTGKHNEIDWVYVHCSQYDKMISNEHVDNF